MGKCSEKWGNTMTYHNQQDQATRMLRQHQQRQNAPQYEDADQATIQDKQQQSQQPQKRQKSGNEAAKSLQSLGSVWMAAAAICFLFGVPMWVAGAKFTVDGWIIVLNRLMSWIGAPWAIGVIPFGLYLGLMGIAGFIYSKVELAWPFRYAHLSQLSRFPKSDGWTHVKLGETRVFVLQGPLFLSVWAVVLLTDIGTTFIGVSSFSGNLTTYDTLDVAWTSFMYSVAASTGQAIAFSAFLTFTPEWLIIGGKKLLQKHLK
jgi:hypothetical protein